MQATVTVTSAQLPELLLHVVVVRHAFLVPQGASLPFRARGPVFHLK
ncbi:hypothetical protein ACIBHX_37225 [Nonomuraea sp. NPDC050536]